MMATPQKNKVLIVGCAGAVGKALAAAIVEKRGARSVIAALRNTALPPALAADCVCEFGIDVRDAGSLDALLAKHAATVECVWNLAAPLSVETAENPAVSEAVTVGGMANLLAACKAHGVARVCFSDSIGSYGASAPRAGATGRWLTENPEQNPGSDYGVQKRKIRELLKAFAADVEGGDTRWAVIPGVLHAEATWGAGTTEYALDAILCAVEGRVPELIVPEHELLPMVYRDDLVRGLVALMDAPREALREPECGYAIAGFSFSADQLCQRLHARFPAFPAALAGDTEGAAARFAMAWPDELSGAAAQADFGYEPAVGFEAMLDLVVAAHTARIAAAAAAETRDRMRRVLAAAGGAGEPGAWDALWLQEMDLWDLGRPTPVLVSLLQELPLGRVLVPGCGRGHDLLALVSAEREVVGIEAAAKAAQHARQLCEFAPRVGIVEEDFFGDAVAALPPFDLIFDYTFFCAIKPSQRAQWGARTARLLAAGGTLLTLVYPNFPGEKADDPDAPGPPHPVSLAAYERALAPHGIALERSFASEHSVERRRKHEVVAFWKKSSAAL